MPEEIYAFLFNSIPQGSILQIEGSDKDEKIIFICSILFVSARFIRIKVPNDIKVIRFLEKKPDLIVRFRRGQYLYQFMSSVLSFETYPFLVMQISLPDLVNTFTLRKNKRIEINFSCMIRFYQLSGIKKYPRTTAIIHDLSVGGLKLSTKATPINKYILITKVTLPDGVKLRPIDSIIKNTKEKDNANLLSLQFIFISDVDKENINYFISKQLQQSKEKEKHL